MSTLAVLLAPLGALHEAAAAATAHLARALLVGQGYALAPTALPPLPPLPQRLGATASSAVAPVLPAALNAPLWRAHLAAAPRAPLRWADNDTDNGANDASCANGANGANVNTGSDRDTSEDFIDSLRSVGGLLSDRSPCALAAAATAYLDKTAFALGAAAAASGLASASVSHSGEPAPRTTSDPRGAATATAGAHATLRRAHTAVLAFAAHRAAHASALADTLARAADAADAAAAALMGADGAHMQLGLFSAVRALWQDVPRAAAAVAGPALEAPFRCAHTRASALRIAVRGVGSAALVSAAGGCEAAAMCAGAEPAPRTDALRLLSDAASLWTRIATALPSIPLNAEDDDKNADSHFAGLAALAASACEQGQTGSSAAVLAAGAQLALAARPAVGAVEGAATDANDGLAAAVRALATVSQTAAAQQRWEGHMIYARAATARAADAASRAAAAAEANARAATEAAVAACERLAAAAAARDVPAVALAALRAALAAMAAPTRAQPLPLGDADVSPNGNLGGRAMSSLNVSLGRDIGTLALF